MNINDLKISEYLLLVDLLKANFTLSASLEIIENKKNKIIIKKIIEELVKGTDIKDLLLLKNGLHMHFCFFIQQLSLPEAIIQSIGLYQFEKSILKELLEKLAYPLLIIFISTLCLGFCTFSVIPSLISVLKSSNIDIPIMFVLSINTVSYLLILTLALALFVLIVFVYLYISNQYLVLFKFFKRIGILKLYQFVFSYYFVGYFSELLKYDTSTKRQLSLLSKMSYKSIISITAIKLDNYLNNGDSLEKAILKIEYFSEDLNKLIDIGIKTGSLQEYLVKYLKQADMKINNFTKNILWGFKICSYLLVGMVVVLMSQLLFSPLEMLSII